jgi:hypothetical protein
MVESCEHKQLGTEEISLAEILKVMDHASPLAILLKKKIIYTLAEILTVCKNTALGP